MFIACFICRRWWRRRWKLANKSDLSLFTLIDRQIFRHHFNRATRHFQWDQSIVSFHHVFHRFWLKKFSFHSYDRKQYTRFLPPSPPSPLLLLWFIAWRGWKFYFQSNINHIHWTWFQHDDENPKNVINWLPPENFKLQCNHLVISTLKRFDLPHFRLNGVKSNTAMPILCDR